MAPTLVFDRGRPSVALGSPGGATIITTVLQTLVNHVDFGLGLPEAIAEPRASQRNATLATPAEQAFIDRYSAALTPFQQTFHLVTPGPPNEIGAVEGIRFFPGGRQQAAAEPTRRGGGSAMVVRPG